MEAIEVLEIVYANLDYGLFLLYYARISVICDEIYKRRCLNRGQRRK